MPSKSRDSASAVPPPPPVTDDDFPAGATATPPARKGNGADGAPHLANQNQSDFPVTWVADAVLDLTSRPIVKGLIEQASFNVIFGPSGSGKSFFTADLCQHIAIGNQWRGRNTRRALVVYVASEAGASILKRFVGWRDNRLGDVSGFIPLAIMTRGPNLLDAVETMRLSDQLSRLQDAAGLPLGMTVFDTLSRSIPGGDENSAEDMTRTVQAADHLRERYGCATAYVHHSGKDPDKGARGHSALFAAADLVLRVQDRVATVDKVRDGVSGERFPFSLDPVEIGTDADGDPVMTCLVNTEERESSKRRTNPVGKNQRVVYLPLQSLCSTIGQSLPETSAIPKGVKAVQVDDLMAACLPKFPGIPAWRAKQRISTALMSLQASDHIGVHNDWIWLVSPEPAPKNTD